MQTDRLIQKILTEKKWRQEDLAASLGVTQATISRWISGQSKPKYEEGSALHRLANEILPESISATPTGKFFGKVGAGAKIYMPDDVEGSYQIDTVEAPPTAPDGVGCVEVYGDSMYPRYFEGERLFFVFKGNPPHDLIGKECVIELSDRSRLVKILRRGSQPNKFHLESYNAPMLEDQEVVWAAPIKWTERKS